MPLPPYDALYLIVRRVLFVNRLPYVETTILEVLRYKTVLPVSMHRTLRDTEVGGYFIPARTTVSRSRTAP